MKVKNAKVSEDECDISGSEKNCLEEAQLADKVPDF